MIEGVHDLNFELSDSVACQLCTLGGGPLDAVQPLLAQVMNSCHDGPDWHFDSHNRLPAISDFVRSDAIEKYLSTT